MRWSIRLKYASYCASPGSSIALSLLFIAQRCSLFDGTGCDGLIESEEGMTNGREPLGDAWLFAEAIRNGILENLRYACDMVSLWWGNECATRY